MSPLTLSPAPSGAQLLAVFTRELKSQRKAFLGWTLPALGLLALVLSMQPQMAKDAGLMALKMEAMPKEMIQALGLSLDNLGDPVVWLATGFIYPALLGGLMAGLLGASVVAREEQLHTAEMLLVQPVSRTILLLGKALAGVVLVSLYSVVLAVVGAGIYAVVDVGDYHHARYFGVFGGLLLAQLSLFGITLLVSVSVKQARGAVPVGLGVTFGLWGAGIAGAAAEKLKPLTYLSPFKATEPSIIARTGELPDAGYALPIVFVATVALAAWRYRHKDIHG